MPRIWWRSSEDGSGGRANFFSIRRVVPSHACTCRSCPRRLYTSPIFMALRVGHLADVRSQDESRYHLPLMYQLNVKYCRPSWASWVTEKMLTPDSSAASRLARSTSSLRTLNPRGGEPRPTVVIERRVRWVFTYRN